MQKTEKKGEIELVVVVGCMQGEIWQQSVQDRQRKFGFQHAN